jgi:hypothetical protein
MSNHPVDPPPSEESAHSEICSDRSFADSVQKFDAIAERLSLTDELIQRLDEIDCAALEVDVTRRREVAQRSLWAIICFLRKLPIDHAREVTLVLTELMLGIDQLQRGRTTDFLKNKLHGPSSPIRKGQKGDPKPLEIIRRATVVAAIEYVRLASKLEPTDIGYRTAAEGIEGMAWPDNNETSTARRARSNQILGIWRRFPKHGPGSELPKAVGLSNIHQISDETGLERLLPVIREALQRPARSRR